MAAPEPLDLGALGGFHDQGVVEADFRGAVLDGLARPRKRIPAKFFYDAEGSRLFERICELREYYPTRTEMALLRAHGAEIAELAGPDAALIEFGSGSSAKARLLLEALTRPHGYVPIDISRRHLLDYARGMAERYPNVTVIPVCADYTRSFELPGSAAAGPRLGFFPGSTIGNFQPIEAAGFLGRAAMMLGAGNGLLIGVDLVKDERVLHAAYNDADGVTAAFNLNLLARMERELGAELDISRFAHHAFYNAERSCIEMHLKSLERQAIRVAGETFGFEAGETIHTEDSHKYTIGGFHDLARASGWRPEQSWSDPEGLFSLHYLVAQ